MAARGDYRFEVDERGHLVDGPANLERARRMLLDWSLILYHGGPGTKDGDGGSWHVFCHLAAAAGLFEDPDGRPGWTGITFDETSVSYNATFTFEEGNAV